MLFVVIYFGASGGPPVVNHVLWNRLALCGGTGESKDELRETKDVDCTSKLSA